MKVLYLGNSGDVGDYVPKEQRVSSLLEAELQTIYGMPFEVVTKGMWPDARLAGVVEKWMDSLQPDLVYLGVNAWWTTHESVPLKVRRVLGPIGRPVERAGFRMAETNWLSRTAAFHWAKRLVARVVGGDPHFWADELASNLSDAIRVISRSEGTTLIVKGPQHRRQHAQGKKRVAAAEERRLEVHRRLRDFCGGLHVEYFGSDTAWHPNQSYKGMLADDRFHTNATAHKRRLVEAVAYLSRACELHGIAPRTETPVLVASRSFDFENGVLLQAGAASTP